MMSNAHFDKYTNSPEFKAILKKYENAMAMGELVYFDSDDIIDIAEHYHVSGDLENAEAAATYCSRLYPDLTTPLLFKARMAIIDYGDIDLARKYMDMIPEEDDSLESTYVRAEIMMAEGEEDKAEEFLCRKYSELQECDTGDYDSEDEREEEEDEPEEESDNGNDRQGFAVDVAMMYCDHGKYDMAMRWLLRIDKPDDSIRPEFYDSWTRVYLAQEQWAKAEEMADKLIDTDAFNATAWLMMSDAQFHNSHFLDALQSAEYAEAIAPGSPDAYIAKGNCMFALNRLDEAIQCFERYLEIYPGDPIGELLLASVLYTQNNIQEAYKHISILTEKIDSLPQLQAIEALRTSASVASKSGDTELALQCCDRLEGYGTEQQIEADIIRGAVYTQANDIQNAVMYFSKAAKVSGYDVNVFERIGVTYYQAGLMSVAYNMLKEAITPYETGEDPHCPEQALAYLTAVCHELGKRKEYIHYLAMAVDIAPLDISSAVGVLFPPGTEPKDYLKIELERGKDNIE